MYSSWHRQNGRKNKASRCQLMKSFSAMLIKIIFQESSKCLAEGEPLCCTRRYVVLSAFPLVSLALRPVPGFICLHAINKTKNAKVTGSFIQNQSCSFKQTSHYSPLHHHKENWFVCWKWPQHLMDSCGSYLGALKNVAPFLWHVFV